MSHLRVGSRLKPAAVARMGLVGTWSIWSQAAECPGGFFVIPADAPARAMGIKFAVVRATLPAAATEPLLELRRCDPPRPDPTEKKKETRR